MSVAIAFVYSWKLSLLILSFIPFQIVGSYIEGKVIGWSDAQLIRDEDEAGKSSICFFFFCGNFLHLPCLLVQ